MKKFMLGFILGAFFFGSIGAAAVLEDTILIKWDINAIEVDGKEVTIRKTNPAFTYNGVAYIPSYIISELNYTPSRTPDGRTILLKSKGKEVYPGTVQAKRDGSLITPNSNISSGVTASFRTNSADPLVVDNKSYENYIYFLFNKKPQGVTSASSKFSFTLDNEYKRFSMTGSLISKEHALNNSPVVVKVYLTNLKNQDVLYKTYTFNANRKNLIIDIPLQDALGITFEVSNTSGAAQEFAMLNAVFIK